MASVYINSTLIHHIYIYIYVCSIIYTINNSYYKYYLSYKVKIQIISF